MCFILFFCRGLGFTIAGGLDRPVAINDNGLFVSMIVDNGTAAVDGRLAVGDRILQVYVVKHTINVFWSA